jgi:Uma2 family endonuclease
MDNALATLTKTEPSVTIDRPGWIPFDLAQEWDPDPYAYQTEEELMPAGGLHGHILTYMMELLRHILETRGLMLLVDTFMLYRDEDGVKQRISPDFLLMPFRFPPPSSYDLDVEPPPPLVVEITSPKSHASDLERKVGFYLGLGIPAYLVIDAITPGQRPRRQIELHLWRLAAGQVRKAPPDAEGGLVLPEMGLRILAQGQQLKLVDEVTGEVLRDMGAERRARQAERRGRQEAEGRANEAEARLKELEAKLKQSGLL